jgi:hypothetical protein
MGEQSPKTDQKEPRRYLDLSKTNSSNSNLESKSKDYLDYCTEDYLLSLAKVYNTSQGYVKLDRMYKDFTKLMDYINGKNGFACTRLFSMDERDVQDILSKY